MNIPELPPAAHLKVDLFPAKVSGLPDGTLDRVRFVATDQHIHVLKLTGVGDVDLIFSTPLGSVARAPEVGVRGVRAFTLDGHVIEAQKSLNCGCGMGRLRNAKLFNPMLALEPLPYEH